MRSGSLRQEMSLGRVEPLRAGSLVRVAHASDPWLRRYRGMRGSVQQDDGHVVEVVLGSGALMSFWRTEVEPLAPSVDRRPSQHSNCEEPRDLVAQREAVSGPSLQAERRRAGLTQHVVATAMGVSVPRISQIEARAAVRAATVMRYLQALRIAMAPAA